MGLVGAGPISSSFIASLPVLRDELGPVMANSCHLASRIVNLLRAGHPAQAYEEFQPCHTVLISVPDAKVAGVVTAMAQSAVDWRGKAILLCSLVLDSSDLWPIGERGADTGSLALVKGERRRFVVEGARAAVREARRIAASGPQSVIEIHPGAKALYCSGVCFGAWLFLPLVVAAAECFRRAGLAPVAASSLAAGLVQKSLRAYLHSGRKAWSNPLVSASLDLERELEALQRASPMLARYFRQSVEFAQELFGQPAEPGAAQAG